MRMSVDPVVDFFPNLPVSDQNGSCFPSQKTPLTVDFSCKDDFLMIIYRIHQFQKNFFDHFCGDTIHFEKTAELDVVTFRLKCKDLNLLL